MTKRGDIGAREAGRADARRHAASWLAMPPRARSVLLADRALARGGRGPLTEAYYVGLLEGLLDGCRAEAVTVRNNPVRVASWAERAYSNFHWGAEPDEVIEAEGPTLSRNETLWSLGELVELTYRTSKGDGLADYRHKFRPERPLLTCKQNGCLIVIGGGYSITARGIVD